ncbi:MAG TPA: DASS family sodium-coupled anion symporter [Woeseiaceae bacterium]|nr:DASS family sodium-coupled anion symporter [Woeseiaceae bacterium]
MRKANNGNNGRATHQSVGLWLGPALAIAVVLGEPPGGLTQSAWNTAAMGVLMAVWWATEAVPIAVTALLPLVFFPLLGIADMETTSAPFANKVIYLFLGGFMVALAMQRWNLHRRIALTVLQHAGGNGRSLVGGFMLASALLSMWVMNTSTTMMLLPIAVSITHVIHGTVDGMDERARHDFQYALLLGVAYASTIGGMTTLVGTAPNAMMAAFMLENYGTRIDFARWMLVGVPLALMMLPLAWLALTRWVFRVDFRTSREGLEALRRMKDELGPVSAPERRVGIVFTLLALTWICRPLLVKLPGLAALDDSGIAMAGAVALFLIPSGDRDDPLLIRWRHIEKLPWSILLLFGGGLALAGAVSHTGLAEWIGGSLHALGSMPVALLVVLASAMIIFLTELTSNIATTATFLPVVGAVALEAGIDPIVLTVPVTFAASCAFMLPVATPPNAIVFGSGLLAIPRMARAGLLLNLIGIVLVSAVALTLAPRFLQG